MIGSDGIRDEAFFRELYEACHRAVYAFFLARTGSRELAKDLMQETYARAWRGIRAARAMGFDAGRLWLMRIARNLLTDHYRRSAAGAGAEERMRREAAAAPAHAEPPGEAYDARERVRRVGEAIRRLPAELREPLLMQAVGGLNSSEIGKLCGLPAGTVRYRISAARRMLREMLGEEGGGTDGSGWKEGGGKEVPGGKEGGGTEVPGGTEGDGDRMSAGSGTAANMAGRRPDGKRMETREAGVGGRRGSDGTDGSNGPGDGD